MRRAEHTAAVPRTYDEFRLSDAVMHRPPSARRRPYTRRPPGSELIRHRVDSSAAAQCRRALHTGNGLGSRSDGCPNGKRVVAEERRGQRAMSSTTTFLFFFFSLFLPLASNVGRPT